MSCRNFARRSDVHCRPKREASREIDEHPETLKTCRRSAIGTRASAIIGNRSALMDRYRGSFPLRSPLFLFFFIPRCRWRGRRWRRSEEESRGKRNCVRRRKRRRRGSREESLNHAPSEYGRNYCRRLMSRCSRDASLLYEESSSSSLPSSPFSWREDD